MVLEYLLKPESHQAVLSIHGVNDWYVQEGHPGRWDIYIFRSPYPPYFAIPYAVHETFALEVAEVLYRTILVRVVGAAQLEVFLRRDILGTGCIPYDHIRHIEIEMRVAGDRRYSSPYKLEYTKFTEYLAPLLKIKRLKGLEVRLVVDRSVPASPLSDFDKFEEVLAPLIHQLHHSGARVGWYSRNEDFGPPYAVDMPALNRDYTQTMEEMMDDIASDSVFVTGPPFQAYHNILTAIGCKWPLNGLSPTCVVIIRVQVLVAGVQHLHSLILSFSDHTRNEKHG
jgi:hypothetical protein